MRKTGLFDAKNATKPKYVTCLAFGSNGDVLTGMWLIVQKLSKNVQNFPKNYSLFKSFLKTIQKL